MEIAISLAVGALDSAGVWLALCPRTFQVLIQLQLMGLYGALLTADLFNRFVFFEVLLAASYGLLLHGGGMSRVRAGLHYIAINLVASLLLLIGAAVPCGVAGTLNMAGFVAKLATLKALLEIGSARILALFALLIASGLLAATVLLHVFDLEDEAVFLAHFRSDDEIPLKEIIERAACFSLAIDATLVLYALAMGAGLLRVARSPSAQGRVLALDFFCVVGMPVAALGLTRLVDFFTRVRAPALASIIRIGARGGGLSLHVWLVIIVLSITAPVTTVVLARAAPFQRRQAGDALLPPPGGHLQRTDRQPKASAARPAITAMHTRLSTRPQRIMVACGTCSVANTIALGGVATGSMKAHDAEAAMAAASITGGSPRAGATPMKMGTSSAALAVLLTSSVRKTTKATTATITSHAGKPCTSATKASAR